MGYRTRPIAAVAFELPLDGIVVAIPKDEDVAQAQQEWWIVIGGWVGDQKELWIVITKIGKYTLGGLQPYNLTILQPYNLTTRLTQKGGPQPLSRHAWGYTLRQRGENIEDRKMMPCFGSPIDSSL